MGFVNFIECENCRQRIDTTNNPFGYVPSGWLVLGIIGEGQKLFCSDACVAGYERIRKLIKIGPYTIDEWFSDFERVILDGNEGLSATKEANIMQLLGHFKLALQHRMLGEG